MVQTRKSKLKSRSWRLEQPSRKKPYFETLLYGVLLGYRRTQPQTNGTWVVRVTRNGNDWTKAIGKADDYDKVSGPEIVLDYDKAQDEAKRIANAGKPTSDNTIKAALDRYEADLKTRDGDIKNISRVRRHLPDKLAQKAVGTLVVVDLRQWRDDLATKMRASSANRTAAALRAALNLAAETDERITNRKAWKDGLKAILGAGTARNVILTEPQVRAIIAAAYRESDEFGLLVELSAVTGARPSQLLRLQGEDVQTTSKPRLMMPASRKGRGTKKMTHCPVPISESLAKRLAGRTGTLLLQPDGEPWSEGVRGRSFDKAVEAVGLDPSVVTAYALRHTSIVRQLVANVPIRIVAVLHDTSVAMIEKNYSKYIADHADELARAALLETSAENIPFRPEGTGNG
jgi:integrase